MVITYLGYLLFYELRKLFLALGSYSLIVGKVAIVRFFRESDAFGGAKRSILRGRLLILKENLIQFIAVTNLTAVKIEERNEKSNSIHRQENAWQHRLVSWVSSVFFGLLYAVVARLY